MARLASFLACLFLTAHHVAAVTFAVPTRVGTGGYAYAPLDPAPVGIS